MSSQEVRGSEGRKPPEVPLWPESEIAAQEPSSGGLLTSETFSGWQWFFIVISFGIAAYFFAQYDAKQEENKVLTFFPESSHGRLKPILESMTILDLKNLITLLQDPLIVDHILNIPPEATERTILTLVENPVRSRYLFHLSKDVPRLLVGRVSQEVALMTNQTLLTEEEFDLDWLKNLGIFLNNAQKIENLKPGEFKLYGLNDEAYQLNNQCGDLLGKIGELLPRSKDDNTLLSLNWISNLLIEIAQLTILVNHQVMDDTITFSPDGRSKPYLFGGDYRRAPFALRYEIRQNPKRLHITDPITKATRTVKFGPKEDLNNNLFRLAKGIYELSHPSREKSENWLQEGNLYVLPGGAQCLSLSPDPEDEFVATLFQTPYAGVIAARLAHSGKHTIRFPLKDPESLDPISLEVEKNDEGYIFKLSFQNIPPYPVTYLLRPGETHDQLRERVFKDHTLERDLLLFKSYIARGGPSE